MSNTMTPAEVLSFLDGRLEISRSINGAESEPTRRLVAARATVSALVAERDALRSILAEIVAADDAAIAELRDMGLPVDAGDARTLTERARAALAGAGHE